MRESVDLQADLDAIAQRQFAIVHRIGELSGDRIINVGSPKQVADLLYGDNAGGSTSKDVLENMAVAGNEIAANVLHWRKVEALRRKLMAKKEAFEEKELAMTPYERGRRKTALQKKQKKKVIGASNAKASINGNAQVISRAFSTASANDDDGSTKELDKNETAIANYLEPQNNEALILVDASGFIFRAYHAMPPMHRFDGTPTGAVLGICNILSRLVLVPLLAGSNPRVVFVFDSPGKNFRHEIYDLYKANRPECPIDLIPQFDLVRQAALAFGVPTIECAGYEADDVIATLATMSFQDGVDVDILSSDKDLMQLVTPIESTTQINMVDPIKMTRITHDAVVKKWGVSAEDLGDLLALAGDSSDNVPGVRGIGPKIAASLISEFGSLEECLTNADQVKQKGRREKLIEQANMARLSRRLVDLDRSIPTNALDLPNEGVKGFCLESINEDRIINFLDQMEFRDLKRRTLKKFGRDSEMSFKKRTGYKKVTRKSDIFEVSRANEGDESRSIPF
eukprot:CAMPEP_0116014386 /NCGR_PEP_ID=MMETSP0321-20121206/6247_1 /TAXON_ID=163516 /ORGANISM="Leptocylindrus danicus var. danicus, Strain B650" /LENGTH=511 /DNA_ID=CAMNT_0003484029 /DNA_START=50 /DNA_END=1585 /DNA_ORIENTATION=+